MFVKATVPVTKTKSKKHLTGFKEPSNKGYTRKRPGCHQCRQERMWTAVLCSEHDRAHPDATRHCQLCDCSTRQHDKTHTHNIQYIFSYMTRGHKCSLYDFACALACTAVVRSVDELRARQWASCLCAVHSATKKGLVSESCCEIPAKRGKTGLVFRTTTACCATITAV